ncbi:MAG: NAD(P)H-dependent oxidoreductase subunit E [Candidatus Eisenbacteria sp.]|nr:NAD(P)H-dependent oxidoreductase subunit E [Candidatus Eisenbacteria bacterium]
MSTQDVAKLRAAHEVVVEVPFEVTPIQKGYASRTLRLDLATNEITTHPVSQQMRDLWVGGKGFDLWLMFQEISKETRWDSPENPLCFASGPLGGTTSFPGSGKTIVTAISPSTGSVMDCNVGGYFGPFLKFSGFDALTIVGKAPAETLLVIDATTGKITIERAPLESIDAHLLSEELTEMYADDEIDKRYVSVVSAGRGAQHTRMGVLNFSFYDWRKQTARIKQAGRGGIGTVFRDKKLKALVVKNRAITPAWTVQENKVAQWVTPKKLSVLEDPRDLADLRSIIAKWNRDPEYAIEMMQDVQKRFRHIPRTAIDEICRATRTPRAHLYHIATFYKAFSLEPRGETMIQVCLGTACHVKGAARILDAFQRELGIRAGETTGDATYSLEAVRCLGACSIAPVVKIGEDVHGNVQAKDAGKLLAAHRGGQATGKGAGTPGAKPSGATPASTAVRNLAPADLDRIASEHQAARSQYKGMLMVCTGTGCVSAGGFAIRDRLQALLAERKLESDFLVVGTGCNGFCAMGPIVVVQPEGIFYQQVTEEDLTEIIEQHLLGGRPVERLLHKDPVSGAINPKMSDIGFFTKQQLIALRNKGLIDPENIEDYIARGGYRALRKALGAMTPADVRQQVLASGIRGRGGGGFPAGVKWEAGYQAAQERGEEIYIVCNGDEGDPGAFMDRSIVETDPHAVIEGMLLGAYAVGARQAFVYIRLEYPLALERLETALAQARAAGLFGERILGSDFSCDIQIHRGAGAFVCGESTALMASMSGRPGEPRAKYVHNVEYGYRDKPTVLNNVETWANIPPIIEKGAEWFARIGTGDVRENPWNGSSGTKVFALVGDIRNTGLVEVPMGITLREIVEEIGGGIPNGRAFKAIQTGGPSGGCLPADKLDMPVDFDSLTEAGSMMGSGGMIVMDEKICMVDVARYFVDFLLDESCGKCTPCREGLFALSRTLDRICRGEGRDGDIEFLEEVSKTVQETSLCQLGATAPNPILSTLQYFRDEYEEHIREGKCRAGVCKALIRYTIDAEKCNGCHACFKPCPTDAITGDPKAVHLIDEGKCIRCGICYEVCRFDAVEVR